MAMLRSRMRVARSGPISATVRARLIFWSCSPASALVAGVEIGSGSRAALPRPAGSGRPQIDCVAWYSFQPLPAREPRTTASIGIRGRRRTTDRGGLGLDGEGGEPLHQHRAAPDLRRFPGADHAFGVCAGQVVRAQMAELVEPEQRHLRE